MIFVWELVKYFDDILIVTLPQDSYFSPDEFLEFRGLFKFYFGCDFYCIFNSSFHILTRVNIRPVTLPNEFLNLILTNYGSCKSTFHLKKYK